MGAKSEKCQRSVCHQSQKDPRSLNRCNAPADKAFGGQSLCQALLTGLDSICISTVHFVGFAFNFTFTFTIDLKTQQSLPLCLPAKLKRAFRCCVCALTAAASNGLRLALQVCINPTAGGDDEFKQISATALTNPRLFAI